MAAVPDGRGACPLTDAANTMARQVAKQPAAANFMSIGARNLPGSMAQATGWGESLARV